jgi:dolichol-phosphate mannosyltransferase
MQSPDNLSYLAFGTLTKRLCCRMTSGMRDEIRSAQHDRWQILVATLAFGMVLLRAILCAKLGLGDDEAYYWDWSRRIQLSYYDHPGMTAWLIKFGCSMFGATPFGVRVFGQICNVISGVFLWKLGNRLFGPVAAMLAIVFYLFAPIYSLGGLLMVPDAPMGAAWMAVAYFAWRILGEKESRVSLWAVAGIILGLGLISKYTIILLALSLVLLMLTDQSWRKEFARPGFWLAVVIAAVLCLPIEISPS